MLYNFGMPLLFNTILRVIILFNLTTGVLSIIDMSGGIDTNEVAADTSDMKSLPLIINTWAFTRAAEKAWESISKKFSSPVETVEYGCQVCQHFQCDFTVGFGGSPDENGETTLDAMIMDGNAMNVGAVGGLRRVKDAVGVARRVLENTEHSIIVGELATDFAMQMQYRVESLSTNKSTEVWKKWKSDHCQPNFWQHVFPDPKFSCGPYNPTKSIDRDTRFSDDFERPKHIDEQNHDTITMIAIDRKKRVAVGTSSNGANHKIPGRVGDAPIPGAGGYADATVGAAAATGDGDVMMRFLPSFLAVEEMRRGASPTEAAETAIKRINKYYPKFFGAIIAANVKGEYGAACNGMKEFPFCVANPNLKNVTVKKIPCFNSDKS